MEALDRFGQFKTAAGLLSADRDEPERDQRVLRGSV